MKSHLSFMPFLALTFAFGSAASAELKALCDKTCGGEMTAIVDSGLSKKLFEYDERDEAIDTLTAIASKSEYQSVRLKGIEVLKQAALNLNAEVRIKALDSIALIAKGSANLQTEAAALNILGTSADSSFVQLALRTLQNIDDIATQSPNLETKKLANALLWEASWSKSKVKREAAHRAANNIANSILAIPK